MVAKLIFWCLAVTPLVFVAGINDVFNLPKLVWIFLTAALLFFVNIKEKIFTGKNTFLVPVLLILFWHLATLHRCVNVYLGIYSIVVLILFVTLYLNLENFLSADEKKAEALVKSVVAVSVIVSVYGLLQVAGVDFFSWTFVRSPMSTLGRRNFAAEYLVMAIPCVYYLLAAEKADRFFLLAAFFLLFLHLVLTFTRASYIGFFFSSVFFLLLFFSGKRKKIPAGKVFTILLVIFLFVQTASAAINTFEKGSLKSRLLVWKVAAKMVRHNPVFGVGPGNFEIRYPEYKEGVTEVLETAQERVTDVHNEYLEMAVETGIPGFLLFMWLLFAAGKTCFVVYRKSGRSRRLFIAAVSASLVAVSVNALASFPFQNPATMLLFWINLALVGSMAREKTGRELKLSPRILNALFAVFLVTGLNMSFRGLAASFYIRKALKAGGAGSVVFAERAEAYNPFSYETLFQAGRVAIDAGDYRKAYRFLLRSKMLHPNSETTHNNLGMVYFKTGHYREAEESFLASLKLNTVMPETYNNLGAVYIKTGRHGEAIPYLKKAVALKGDFYMAAFNLGMAYHVTGEHEKAREYWVRTLDINPDFYPAAEWLKALP